MKSIDSRAGFASAISRRAFLAGGVAVWTLPGARRYQPTSRFRAETAPFTLGVASGDPSPDGVVLWTRLAPDPLNDGGMPDEPVEVHWEIALDEAMRRRVRYGRVTASPESAHSVHVELNGLEPD